MNLTMENLIGVISKSIKIDSSELSGDISLNSDIYIDSIETAKLCKDLIDSFACKLNVIDIKSAENIGKIYQVIEKAL